MPCSDHIISGSRYLLRDRSGLWFFNSSLIILRVNNCDMQKQDQAHKMFPDEHCIRGDQGRSHLPAYNLALVSGSCLISRSCHLHSDSLHWAFMFIPVWVTQAYFCHGQASSMLECQFTSHYSLLKTLFYHPECHLTSIFKLGSSVALLSSSVALLSK